MLLPRRVPRQPVRIPVTLDLVGGGTSTDILLLDLSSLGFMAECLSPLPIGSAGQIELPAIGPRSITIIWQLGRHLGARFDDLLPVSEVLRAVLAGLPAGDCCPDDPAVGMQ